MIRPIDLANRWNVLKQTVNNYINEGMPLTSIEDAEAWRNSRINYKPETEAVVVSGEQNYVSNETLEDSIKKQAYLRDEAYKNYLQHLNAGDKEMNKSYATYEKALKMFLSLEDKRHNRLVAEMKLIETQTALEILGKVLSQMRNDLIQFGAKNASKANPESPGTALKVIDDEVNAMLSRWSSMEKDATANMTSNVLQPPKEDEIIIVEPSPEDVENE